MTMKSIKKWWVKNVHAKKLFPIFLIFFGLTGTLASITIAVEKEQLLKHPEVELLCNINPIYSCGNVFTSPQSHIAGVSIEYVGIAMFAVLLCVGVVMLAGAKMKSWFWYAFLAGMLSFMLMVLWFFRQSVYVIGSMCIFCSSVWFSGWAITASGFAWMYDNDYFKQFKKLQRYLMFIRKNIALIWFLFILTLATLVLNHFWFYYGQYFK